MHRPDILILDEPTSNLDKDGIEMVLRRVSEQRENAILIVATNDTDEATWCARKIELGTHS
jgi:energy-coupling factor transporter ATP-binding protein EcfA2